MAYVLQQPEQTKTDSKIFPPLKFSSFVGFLRQKTVTVSKAEHKLSQY